MKLEKYNTYLIGRFMHCEFIRKVPECLKSWPQKNNEYHPYCTKSANITISKAVKVEQSKTGIRYKGAIIWSLEAQQEST